MDKLGYYAHDKVTGFEGIITAKCIYIYGCVQYALTPKVRNNEIQRPQWFDEYRLEILGEKVNPINPEDVRNPLLKEPKHDNSSIEGKSVFIIHLEANKIMYGPYSSLEKAQDKLNEVIEKAVILEHIIQ